MAGRNIFFGGMLVLLLGYRLNIDRGIYPKLFGKLAPRSRHLALVTEEDPLIGIDIEVSGLTAVRAGRDYLAGLFGVGNGH